MLMNVDFVSKAQVSVIESTDEFSSKFNVYQLKIPEGAKFWIFDSNQATRNKSPQPCCTCSMHHLFLP